MQTDIPQACCQPAHSAPGLYRFPLRVIQPGGDAEDQQAQIIERKNPEQPPNHEVPVIISAGGAVEQDAGNQIAAQNEE